MQRKFKQVESSHSDVEKYDCQRETPLNHKNKELIYLFEVIRKQRYVTGDARSENTYSKVIAALKSCPKDIESLEELEKIPSIGPATESKACVT